MARHVLHAVVVLVTCALPLRASERSPWRMEVKSNAITIAMSECNLKDPAFALAQQEATRVWSGANITLRWVPAPELPYASVLADWLLVRCDPKPILSNAHEATTLLPIATIRFINARPLNTIMLSLANANALLLRDSPEARNRLGSFIAFREIRLGRMLGRAIAHEIGHFLSQSGEHTRTGLMRPTHTVAALTGSSLGAFRTPEMFQY